MSIVQFKFFVEYTLNRNTAHKLKIQIKPNTCIVRRLNSNLGWVSEDLVPPLTLTGSDACTLSSSKTIRNSWCWTRTSGSPSLHPCSSHLGSA